MVTVHTGGSPGVLGFDRTIDAVTEGDLHTATIERLGGTTGAVGVTLVIEHPDGGVSSQDVTWPDGDGQPRSLVGIFSLPPGSGMGTARLSLLNPTGGATVSPSRDVMVVAVAPDDWPPQLVTLLLLFQLLLSGFSPLWFLALAGPAALLVARRRRGAPRS